MRTPGAGEVDDDPTRGGGREAGDPVARVHELLEDPAPEIGVRLEDLDMDGTPTVIREDDPVLIGVLWSQKEHRRVRVQFLERHGHFRVVGLVLLSRGMQDFDSLTINYLNLASAVLNLYYFSLIDSTYYGNQCRAFCQCTFR